MINSTRCPHPVILSFLGTENIIQLTVLWLTRVVLQVLIKELTCHFFSEMKKKKKNLNGSLAFSSSEKGGIVYLGTTMLNWWSLQSSSHNAAGSYPGELPYCRRICVRMKQYHSKPLKFRGLTIKATCVLQGISNHYKPESTSSSPHPIAANNITEKRTFSPPFILVFISLILNKIRVLLDLLIY